MFTAHFIHQVILNHTYCGKIAYGKRVKTLVEGSEDEYKIIRVSDFSVNEGKHEALISEEMWESAQAKANACKNRHEIVEKDHQFIYSGLLICPVCGKTMSGVSRHARKTNGTCSPDYYSYYCRSNPQYNGMECDYGQITCSKVDIAMKGILSEITSSKGFDEQMRKLIDEQIDTGEVERELDTAIKAHRQALGVQRKLESELDTLDYSDKHYDRKYESLSRRLDDAFDAIEDAERAVADCEARLESIKKEDLSHKSVYENLRIFNDLFDRLNDREKKIFVRGFIESVELNPGRQIKGNCPIKTIHFKIPVSYNGESVYSLSPENSSDETQNPDGFVTEICYPVKKK